MPIALEWKPEYAIGHEAIDTQHREAIEIIRRLEAADAGERTAEAIGRINDYIESHFRFEEQVMTETGYPDRLAHTAEHQTFATLYRRVMQDGGDARSRTVALLTMLKWFVTHITSERADLRLGEHLRRKAATG